jgi:hypothetical protein
LNGGLGEDEGIPLEPSMNEYAPQAPRPHRGGMILAFGLVGIFCCIVFAILAWVMGASDLKDMKAGSMDRTGEGMTKAGWILGIVAVAIHLLWLLVVLAAVIIPIVLRNRM